MAQSLVSIVTKEVWESPALRPLLVQEQFGSENYVRSEVHSKIRFARTPTTHHIRFAPDCFVVDLRRPELTYLLEYKHTNTPLSYDSRLRQLQAESRADLQFADVGQWEAAAYDNYDALAGLGVRVCVLNYVPYHPRPLLCDSSSSVRPIYRSPGVGTTTKGSRTPWINFDLTRLRSLDAFLCEEHALPAAVVQPLVQPLVQAALRQLREEEIRIFGQ
jgi:hypothetical protein